MAMSGDVTETIPDRSGFQAAYETRRGAYLSILQDLERLLADLFMNEEPRPTIKGRIKSFDSFYKKKIRLLRKARSEGKPPIPINDLVALRIVCPFLGDLARAERTIASHFKVLETERKGSERSFREFGYESIHLLIEIPAELRAARPELDIVACEVQLRTILQEAWAEVEHELVYKAEFTPFDDPMKRKLAALNANLSLSDIIFQEIRDYQRKLSTELTRRRDAFYLKIEENMDGAARSEKHRERADSDIPRLDIAKEQECKPFKKATACEQAEMKKDDFGLSRAKNPPLNESPQKEPSLVLAESNEGIGFGGRLGDKDAASIDDMLLEALYAHNRKNYKRAIAIYGAILQRKPSRESAAIVYKHRGMAYFAESFYEEAVRDFGEVLELDPECYKAAYFRGVVRSVSEDYGKAVEDFDRSLKINPFQFFTLYRRAQAYWHIGDYPKTLADCESALKINPEDEQALELKRLALEKLRM